MASPVRLRARAYLSLLPYLFERQAREEARINYEADNLRLIGANTAKYAGGQYVPKRFDELINPKPEDNRTAEEIAAEVIRRAGLVVK